VAATDCAPCHAQIAAEWERSAHARSWTDPIFQAEYQLAPEPFCRRCHAPLAPDPAGELRAESSAESVEPVEPREVAALAARGIDCAVCHVRGGRLLSVHGRGGAEHPIAADTRLAAGAFCGPCHQFDFPAPEPGQQPRYHPGRPLQNTLHEWRESRHSDQPCQYCHMRRVAGDPLDASVSRPHRDHSFAISTDRDLLAGAVAVSAHARWRGDQLDVTMTISPRTIGHAFPTGDMFREAVLIVRLGDQQRTERLRRDFALTITADARGHLLGEVEDTRVQARAGSPWRRRMTFLAPAASAPPRPSATAAPAPVIEWSLELFRLPLADARERALPEELVRTPVCSGSFRVPAR
jgi:Cytochrome c554 and c-prime